MTDKPTRTDRPATGQDSQSEFETTGEKRYQWPPVRDPDLSYSQKSRNPVQSVITALPLIMVVAGFGIYYVSESRQTHNAPIRAESIDSSGTFTGLSETSDRHYMWIDKEGVAKGVRIQPQHVPGLEELVRGEPVNLQIAPRVSGSKTYWVWWVEQDGAVLLDEQSLLR